MSSLWRRGCFSLSVLALALSLDTTVPETTLAGDSEKSAKQAVEQAAAALYEGIHSETLPNGLRVFLKPVPGATVITTMVAYKVGAADEDLDSTGLAHYLEHLMFKGTDKLMPGDIDRMTLRSGGANNAYTGEDFTVYHFDFASEFWELPLKIEADRMRNLRIDAKHEFEQEKGAVCAELDRNEDNPGDLEEKAILPLLFGKTGPYGHPVIGEREHVRGATAEIIKRFYERWYYPNNAALVVCGGFDSAQVMAKIKELFGPIQSAKLPERKSATPVERKAPVKIEFKSKFDQPRMLMGFNMVPSGDPDAYPLAVTQLILSGGKTSRLYKKFIEGEEIATDIRASSLPGRYPGWFAVYLALLQGQNRDKAEQLLLAEIKRLRDEPVSAAELKRVKQAFIAGMIFDRESVHNLADSIATGVTTNDLDYLKSYLPRISAVTAEDVQRVVRKYLDPEKRVVVWSVPEEKKGGKEERGAAGTRGRGERPARAVPSEVGKAAAGQSGFSLAGTKRVVLPNGLTLLLFENRRLPIVVAESYVKNVRLQEPEDKGGVATLVGRLLDEGTAKHSGQEIAELIENAGGALAMGITTSSAKVLAHDRTLGLGLLLECLMEPSFPKEAFERQQRQLLAEIADNQTRPEERASELYLALLYKNHPLGRPALGKPEVVAKLTPADCKAFHKRVCVPNNCVVALVGDFDSKEVIAEVTKLTAGWQKGTIAEPLLPKVTPPEKFTEKIVTMPEAAQLHFYMGHPGIRRDNPDYYKLLVMDYVLGTGPGFTDRLSARLRDREGLAYTVTANMTSSAGEEVGAFTCYIGTEPKNLARVKGLFLEELNKIRSDAPTKQEVEDAKSYLLGNLPFRFTSNGGIADQLLAIERHKLGFHYLEDFKKAVAAVTPADVHAVAKKYIDPERMVLVVAGAVGPDGRPLLKLAPPKK